MGREERRQKYDLAEEKREVFRTQIRQKYGIKSKEEADLEKVTRIHIKIYLCDYRNNSAYHRVPESG